VSQPTAAREFLGEWINFPTRLDAVTRRFSWAREDWAHRSITQAFGYTVVATVVRIGKLRVMIYSRDHPPPHVHVVAPQGQAKILVEGPGGHPRLEWNLGLSRRELAQALAAVEDHLELILAEWNRVHDDP